MRLPNADRAIITEAKLRLYLLNPEHPKNGGKWKLFAGIGFTAENWPSMAEALRTDHLPLDAVPQEPEQLGRKWLIEGPLQGPHGVARIRSVWMIYPTHDEPHFITAYGRRR